MSSTPKCGNHGVPLEIDEKDKTKTKGRSPCPVSGAMFEWEQDVQSKKYDKNGNPIKTWVVEGND